MCKGGLGSVKSLLSPKVGSKLYDSACVPKLLYGLEVVNVHESNIEKLEIFHCNRAKVT